MNQGISMFSFAGDRRHAGGERRQTPRGGRRVGDKIRLALYTAACSMLVPPGANASEPAPVKFGFDVASVKQARQLGMPVVYGSLWAGAWNQPEKYGWGGIKDQLETAKANGVVPVVQWWYWGDDISPSCVEDGCTDRYEKVHKDKATWYRMTNELADLIVSVMGPESPAIVIVENEFNQGGMETYEPFDGYLVDQINALHMRNLQVAIEFGNWDQKYWKTFDRAVAAADLLGAMALQSSVRDATTYLSGADRLLQAARSYQKVFNKPVMVTDFGFSSYPEPPYLNEQSAVVREIFARMDEFRAAGVKAMLWRMLADDPKFDTANYHREAERSWGLLRADGSAKPAFQPFLNGMVMEKEAAVRVAAAAAAATQAARERANRTSNRIPRRERRGAASIGQAIPRPPSSSPARAARRP